MIRVVLACTLIGVMTFFSPVNDSRDVLDESKALSSKAAKIMSDSTTAAAAIAIAQTVGGNGSHSIGPAVAEALQGGGALRTTIAPPPAPRGR
jgi:hypothetical protein